jgi:hypothetical protein
MSNAAVVTGGKLIVRMQSIVSVSAVLLVAFYDTHGRMEEVLLFYPVPSSYSFVLYCVY